MAEFDFKCSNCGRVLRGDDQFTGRTTTCPACKANIIIPIKPAPAPSVPQPMLVVDTTRNPQTSGAPANYPGAHPLDEKPIFEMRPSWKAFVGQYILAALALIVGLLIGSSIQPTNSVFRTIFTWAGILGAVVILLYVVIKRFSLKYRLTTQRFFILRGIISREVSELELFRVKDVELVQNLFDRIFNIGKLTIYSTDETAPKADMLGIDNPMKMKDTLRLYFREARTKERVRPTEFISDFGDENLGQQDQL
jgi:membrane protein YdbS with pleckstrin-like domain/DNA-directed RNA polymerase subunit RPC12/RpoP